MVQAIMDLARFKHHRQIYTSTATANGILERLGWEKIGTVWEEGTELSVYLKTFA